MSRILFNKPILIIMVLFSAASVFAESDLPQMAEVLEDIDADVRAVLESEDIVFRYDEELKGPCYLPESAFANYMNRLHDEFEPEVMVEALYFIDYPEDLGPESGIDGVLKKLNMITHDVSLISGVKYYSRSSQAYKVLFEDVYRVNNPAEKKRIDSRSAGDELKRRESVYLHMTERWLGEGYYRMEYLAEGDELAICLTNETALSQVITAVGSGDMKIFMQLIPCSEGILIYGYCGIILQNDLLVHIMMNPYYSFFNRMTAMETWLYNSLHNADRLPPLLEPMP